MKDHRPAIRDIFYMRCWCAAGSLFLQLIDTRDAHTTTHATLCICSTIHIFRELKKMKLGRQSESNLRNEYIFGMVPKS